MGQLFFLSFPDNFIDSSFRIPVEIKNAFDLCLTIRASDSNEHIEKTYQNCVEEFKKFKQIHPAPTSVTAFLKACITTYIESQNPMDQAEVIEQLLKLAIFTFWLVDNLDKTITVEQLTTTIHPLFSQFKDFFTEKPLNLLDIWGFDTEPDLRRAVEAGKVQPALGFIRYILEFSRGSFSEEFNNDSDQFMFKQELEQSAKTTLLGLVLESSTGYLPALIKWFQTSPFSFYLQNFLYWLVIPLNQEALNEQNFIDLMCAVKCRPSVEHRDKASPATCLLYALYKRHPTFIKSLSQGCWRKLFIRNPALLADLAKQTQTREEKSFTGLYRHLLRQQPKAKFTETLRKKSVNNGRAVLPPNTNTVHKAIKALESQYRQDKISSPIPPKLSEFNEFCERIMSQLNTNDLKKCLNHSTTSPNVFNTLLFSEFSAIKKLIDQFTIEDVGKLITQFETNFAKGGISSITLNKIKLWFVKRFETDKLPSTLQIKLRADSPAEPMAINDGSQQQEMLTKISAKLLAELKAANLSEQGQNPATTSHSNITQIEQDLWKFIGASSNQAPISEIFAELIPLLSEPNLIDILGYARLKTLEALFETQHYTKLAAKVASYTNDGLTAISLLLLKEHPTFCPQWFKLVPADRVAKILMNILATSSELPAATRLSLVLLGQNFNQLGYLTIAAPQNIQRLGVSLVHPSEIDYNPYFLSRLRKTKKLAVQPVFDRLAALTNQSDYYKIYSGVLNTLFNITLPRSEQKILYAHLDKLSFSAAKQLLLYPLPAAVNQRLLNTLNITDRKGLEDALEDLNKSMPVKQASRLEHKYLLQNAQAKLFTEQLAKHSIIDKLLLKIYKANQTPQVIRNPIYNYFNKNARLASLELNYSEFVSAKNFYKMHKQYNQQNKEAESTIPQITENDILKNGRKQIRKTRIMHGQDEHRTIQLVGSIEQIERVRRKVNLYRLFGEPYAPTPMPIPKQKSKLEAAAVYLSGLYKHHKLSPKEETIAKLESKVVTSQQYKDLAARTFASPKGPTL